jgi:hypothetical protein
MLGEPGAGKTVLAIQIATRPDPELAAEPGPRRLRGGSAGAGAVELARVPPRAGGRTFCGRRTAATRRLDRPAPGDRSWAAPSGRPASGRQGMGAAHPRRPRRNGVSAHEIAPRGSPFGIRPADLVPRPQQLDQGPAAHGQLAAPVHQLPGRGHEPGRQPSDAATTRAPPRPTPAQPLAARAHWRSPRPRAPRHQPRCDRCQRQRETDTRHRRRPPRPHPINHANHPVSMFQPVVVRQPVIGRSPSLQSPRPAHVDRRPCRSSSARDLLGIKGNRLARHDGR